jgi:hypothetical protein
MAGQSSNLSKAEATAKAKGAGCPIGKSQATGTSGQETQLGKSGSYPIKSK